MDEGVTGIQTLDNRNGGVPQTNPLFYFLTFSQYNDKYSARL